jgi:hypothetical protein
LLIVTLLLLVACVVVGALMVGGAISGETLGAVPLVVASAPPG